MGFLGDLIPGLRSLRSLTRGYTLPSLRDWLTRTSSLKRVSLARRSSDLRIIEVTIGGLKTLLLPLQGRNEMIDRDPGVARYALTPG